jgi:hypothetical protein
MKGTATPASFNERYEDNLSKAKTYKEAYELTEQEHVKKFGDRKYSSYTSFKVNRSRYKHK